MFINYISYIYINNNNKLRKIHFFLVKIINIAIPNYIYYKTV